MPDQDPAVTTPPIVDPFENQSLDAYYNETLAEAQALRVEELEDLNIDVMSSIVTVYGCQSKLAQFHGEITQRLGAAVNMKYIDELPRYVGALAHANRVHSVAIQTNAPLTEWGTALAKTHDLLFGDAEGFARHGLIDGGPLPNLKMHNGYRQLASNVLNLVQLLRSNWSKLEGHTALKREQIDQAEKDALRLVKAVGDKEQRIAAATQTAALRQRFWTLFLLAWSEWRRAIKFLRWFEEDEELYAPSLWAGRNSGPRKKTDSKPDEKPADGATPVPTDPAKPAAPVAGGDPAPANGGVRIEQKFDR